MGNPTESLPTLGSEPTSMTNQRYSRRKILTTAAIGGVSLAALKMIGPGAGNLAFGATPTLTGGPTDGATQFKGIPGRTINEQILNYALTLEILESDLYRQALHLASGYPRNNALASNPGVYSLKVGGGGLSTALTAAGYAYLKEYAYVEAAHREFLIAAIKSGGGTPAAKNAGGYVFAGNNNPPLNLKSILQVVLPLEETGVRAYLGALPYFTDLSLAAAAGGIYSTECRHSAAISYTLGIDPGPTKMAGDLTVVASPPAGNTFEYYLAPSTVVKAIQPYFVK